MVQRRQHVQSAAGLDHQHPGRLDEAVRDGARQEPREVRVGRGGRRQAGEVVSVGGHRRLTRQCPREREAEPRRLVQRVGRDEVDAREGVPPRPLEGRAHLVEHSGQRLVLRHLGLDDLRQHEPRCRQGHRRGGRGRHARDARPDAEGDQRGGPQQRDRGQRVARPVRGGAPQREQRAGPGASEARAVQP